MVTIDEALVPGTDDRFARKRRKRNGKSTTALIAQRAAGPVALLVVWWIVSATGLISGRILPTPVAVYEAGANLIGNGELATHLLASAQRAGTGLFFGVIVGVLLALVTGLSRVGERLIDPNLQMLRAMPILALMPLAIVWLGIGETMKVSLVALGVMFPIYLNTHAAIRGADARFLDLAATAGLNKLQLIRHVTIPGALPGFFTGLRFSVAIAWLVLVVAEQTNATSGIGYLMTRARGLSQIDVIMVGLLVYAVLGLASDALVRIIERKALSWRLTR